MKVTQRRTLIQALGAALFGMGFGARAQAPAEVKIGVIYPLTGPGAAVGAELRSALELAVDLINNGAPGVTELPFAGGKGLPNLKGAKIKLVFADHQANPQTGATEAERLITQEKVVAIVGAYTSLIFAPFRFGRPLPPLNGNSVMPGAPLLIRSAASSSALRSSAPTAAPGPVSG